MKTDIEKIFHLLLSNQKANHTLAMQLVKSQGLPSTEKGLLFKFVGAPTQADKLACLSKLEKQQRNELTEGQRFWRMYAICDECFDFMQEEGADEVNIKVFGYTSRQFAGLLVKIEFFTWQDEFLAMKLDHINGLDAWGKQHLTHTLLKANSRRGRCHKSPDKGHLASIGRKTLYPLQYWRTGFDDDLKRFHINIYYATKIT